MRSEIARIADLHGRLILLLLCAAVVITWLYSAWAWPAIDGYPAIERFIDPGWLKTDFYTNAVSGFSPDTVPAAIFGGLQMITGISYEVWIAIANFARCVAMIFLLYAFLRAFTNDRDVSLAGTVLATLSGFMMPHAPGWYWIGGTAEPSGFALALIMGGWIFALGRRLWAACLLMALALPIHPVLALHGALFTAVIAFADYRPEERVKALFSPATILGCLFFAAIFLTLYLAMTGGAHEHISTQDYVKILAHERHAHHFIPTAFGVRTWIAFALSIAALAVVLWAYWETIPRRRLVLATLAAYGVLALAGYLFVEIIPLRPVIQLIPYRFCIALCPVFLAVMACFLMMQIRAQRLLPAVITALMYFSAPLAVANASGYLIHLGALALFTIMVVRLRTASASDGDTPGRKEEVLLGRHVLAAAGAAVLLLKTMVTLPIDMSIPTPANQHPIYRWLSGHTAPDAVILAPQSKPGTAQDDLLSPQKVRLLGHRAVVASQDFPFREDYFHEWEARWQTVLLGRNTENVDRMPEEQILAIDKKFPFDYVLRTVPFDHPHLLREVARVDSTDGRTVYVYKPAGRTATAAVPAH